MQGLCPHFQQITAMLSVCFQQILISTASGKRTHLRPGSFSLVPFLHKKLEGNNILSNCALVIILFNPKLLSHQEIISFPSILPLNTHIKTHLKTRVGRGMTTWSDLVGPWSYCWIQPLCCSPHWKIPAGSPHLNNKTSS